MTAGGGNPTLDNFVFYNFPAMQPDEPEDEYENWKLNSGYLYDRLFVNRLEWPSLSFQWLPGIE